MYKGFMFLHRQLLDWEWFDNSQMVHVWIYFLLKANYQDGKWHGIDVPRGSLITSLDTICKDTGLSKQSVRTCINKLKSTHEITISSTHKYSIVSVCKYGEYNVNVDFANTQTNTQPNTQVTQNQHTANIQLTLLKEDNNINKEIKEEESTNVDKKKEAYSSPLAEMFDKFRKRYKQYGGKVRGLETELENLKKKHKDWKAIIPLLYEAIEKENAARQQAKSMGRFFPEIKNLQTYINNRSWEEYTDECEYNDTDEYHPMLDGIFTTWDDEERCVRISNNNIDGFCDGYTKENRPDGATVKYGMYTWRWSKKNEKWVRLDN